MVLVRVVSIGALILECNLASLFFLDLFECLKEELLDVAPLIQDHLAQCLQIFEFPRFQTDAFPESAYVFTLFFYNLLTLEA